MRFCWIDIFGALHTFRRDFKSPGEHERDRQTGNDKQNDRANDPVRNIKDRENLRDSL